MHTTTESTRTRVLHALKLEYPGQLNFGQLRERLPNILKSTIRTALQSLQGQGKVERTQYGIYRWKKEQPTCAEKG